MYGSAFADGEGDGGSDPTVGTLPMIGSGADCLDQTITLRGPVESIRESVADATGRGVYETIDLGGGEAWMRFYGDVRIELELSELADVEVSIFSGFDGGGMKYRIASREGVGSTRNLGTGFELSLDPIRFANSGLIDEPLAVEALHRTGDRTRTVLEFRATEGRVVLSQDV